MGDSLSWGRDQERLAEDRNRKREAQAIRENIATEWDDWSLTKMKIVEIVADLEYGDEKKALKLLKNREALETYFKTSKAIAEGKLL